MAESNNQSHQAATKDYYLEWNNELSAHFFNREMSGSPVYLHVDKDVICSVGGKLGGGIAEFVDAVKEGPPWTTREGLCQRALQAFHGWRERGLEYPPYLGYLALFVLATEVEGDFAPHAYYPRLKKLLGYADQEPGALPSFDRMLELWDDLEIWSIHDKGGSLGLFKARISGGWIHVGLPTSQTILTSAERRSLPNIFIEAGFDPTSLPPTPELSHGLRVHGAGKLRHRTIQLLTEHDDEGAYEMLLDIVADELADWDGSFHGLEEGGSQPLYVSGTVRLCLTVDEIAGRAIVKARCRMNREFPEEKLLLSSSTHSISALCEGFLPGWSTLLCHVESGAHIDASQFNWTAGEVLTGAESLSSLRFNLAGRPVRILVEGRNEGLPGLVETYELPARGPFYILASEASLTKVKPWLKRECIGSYEYPISEGLPAGWHLFKVKQVESDRGIRNTYPWLALADRARIRFRGGIRQSQGETFFSFAPPEVVLEAASGNEAIVCHGTLLEPSPTGAYKLPNTVPLDARIVVELKRGKHVIGRKSLYLISDFSWRHHEATKLFNEWEEPIEDEEFECFRSAGAITNCYGLEPHCFRIYPLMALPVNRKYERVFFIGRSPGQVAKWPAEELPVEWQPVWAIPLARRGTALYCGSDIDDCDPNVETWGDRERVLEWKDVLWHQRKKIAAPSHPALRRLWYQYQEVAHGL